jgi:hypothetical protein
VFAKREYNPYRGVYAKTGTSTMARLEVARNGSVSDMVASTEDVKSLVVNPAGIIIEHPTSTKPKRT